MKKKLAIIGASYLQVPLINRAKDLGYETHVFAWKCGDEGETIADCFYPISIVEKEEILKECMKINIDGICTIASDLATVTVNYVANNMGLIGNSDRCTLISTNKSQMRKCFENNGDPSPKSFLVESLDEIEHIDFEFPVIVKPTDRSGSRGITRLTSDKGLLEAINTAMDQSFEKKALIEEYAEGNEYSVECISQDGKHTMLCVTQKYTTGAPNFIETGHLEPAEIPDIYIEKIRKTVFHALDSLEIKNSASHSEIKINDDGVIKIIEIGARMGGDFIGSNLVQMSTGYDFVKAVIDVALGNKIDIFEPKNSNSYAAVRFIFSHDDIDVLNQIKNDDNSILVCENVGEISSQEVKDSSSRFGYYLMKADNLETIKKYMP